MICYRFLRVLTIFAVVAVYVDLVQVLMVLIDAIIYAVIVDTIILVVVDGDLLIYCFLICGVFVFRGIAIFGRICQIASVDKRWNYAY